MSIVVPTFMKGLIVTLAVVGVSIGTVFIVDDSSLQVKSILDKIVDTTMGLIVFCDCTLMVQPKVHKTHQI